MTQRIYYTDPTCLTFDATVRRLLTHDGRPAVILDRTAFYPTSGGQPFDTGRLGNVSVIDVVDLDDDILHILGSALGSESGSDPKRDAVGVRPREGDTVRGDIDVRRRRDHMQQHTGQHVLSAAFDRLFDARTASFHLGGEDATIDLAKDVTPAQIAHAEAEANAVVWADRPVTIRFVSPEEAAALALRKDPARSGRLRLIDVDGFDLSACGGTHVSRTGEIGMIAVLASERFKGGSRVTFACGGRALSALHRYRDSVAAGIRLLSVTPEELPAAIERAQQESKELRRSLKHAQEQLATHEGQRLVQGAAVVGGRRVIVEALDGWDANGLKAIASAATAAADVVVALFSGAPAVAVIATSKDVPIDAQAVLKDLFARFGGRGGGKPDLAQGGGLNADAATLCAAAREIIQQHTGT